MMNRNYENKSRDSEARNPCLSLVGEGLGAHRTNIAGWSKGVIHQAPPSNSTDIEVFRIFDYILKIRKCFNIRDTTKRRYMIFLNNGINRNLRKCLCVRDATTCVHIIYSNNSNYQFLKLRLSITDAATCVHIIPSNTINLRISKDSLLEKKHMSILQESSILGIKLREKALETGKLDDLDISSKELNIADITYISATSSIEDDFDLNISENEVALGSVCNMTESEKDLLLELSDNEANSETTQGCDMPYKVKRSTGVRRRVAAFKRQLANESTGSGNINVSSGQQDAKKPKSNGTTPPEKGKKGESEKDKDGDKRRRERKEREEAEWAEIVKSTIKVEVRASNGQKLTETDFARINDQSTKVMMKHRIPAGENWLIKKRGVKQHGIWFRVMNEATVNTMKKVFPLIDPKFDRNPQADYVYEVYGPGECKAFTLRWRISREFESWTVEELQNGILWMNEGDWLKVEDEDNTKRDGIIRVLGKDNGKDAKRREKELLTKDPNHGNITYLVEFEDCLWDNLIEIKEGRLILGIGDGQLEGYDIQEHVKMFLKGETRPNRPQDFGGEIRAQKKAAAKKAAELAAGGPSQKPDQSEDETLMNQDD